jgi:hypothetical protein
LRPSALLKTTNYLTKKKKKKSYIWLDNIFCRIGQSKSTLTVGIFFLIFCWGGGRKLGRGCMLCDIIEMHGEEMPDLENY